MDSAAKRGLPVPPMHLCVASRSPPCDVGRTFAAPSVRSPRKRLRGGIAEGDFYPRVALGGLLGVSSPDLATLDGHGIAASIGPSFSWQLFSSGAISSR